MAFQKAPPMKPVQPLPTAKPPPVSHTQDNYDHHTSPVEGPQPEPPTQVLPGQPGVKIRTLPDVPMHVTKHTNPVGRPKNPNDG